VSGKVLVLPGVANVRFHLAGFVRMLQDRHPGLEVDVRTWGPPLHSLENLRSYQRNIEAARDLADEVTAFRRAHPDALMDIVGYSGGGGVALFVVRSLPDDVMINRLILVAPAISPDFPLAADVLPHVSEFMVNYASTEDFQVGWGTQHFGTMDRKNTVSAGFSGFTLEHPKLVQVHWRKDMIRHGHTGGHNAYLLTAWQRKYLLPALDPGLGVQEIRAVIAERAAQGSDARVGLLQPSYVAHGHPAFEVGSLMVGFACASGW
jgi:pimeloyl-ACP methyl ester carboxylesterase